MITNMITILELLSFFVKKMSHSVCTNLQNRYLIIFQRFFFYNMIIQLFDTHISHNENAMITKLHSKLVI